MGKKVTVGYRYYLGMHMILCHGPVDHMLRINVDGRRAWDGLSTGGRLDISQEGLFGGEEREGGVAGSVDLEMGGTAQGANDYLVSQLGADVPGYRGVVGMVLRKCYLGTSAYLKRWAFRLQRINVRQNGLEQWYREKAAIVNGVDIVPPLLVATIPALQVDPAHPERFMYSIENGNLRVDEATGGGIDTTASTFALRKRVYSMAGTLLSSVDYTSPKLPNPVYLPTIYYDYGEVIWPSGGAGKFSQLAWGGGTVDVTALNGPLSRFFMTVHAILTKPLNAPASLDDYYSLQYAVARPNRTLISGDYLYSLANDGGTRFWIVKTQLASGLVFQEVLVSANPDSLSTDDTGAFWVVYPGEGTYGKVREYGPDLALRRTYTIPNGSGGAWTPSPHAGISVSQGYMLVMGLDQAVHLFRINTSNSTLTEVAGSIAIGGTGTAPIYNLGQGLAYCRGQIIRIQAWGPRDMNPAHIIRECLTDPDWGMGYAEADVDDVSFMAAADQLYTEQMGMSILWDRQIPIESFIQEVLKHIDAALYVSRSTGKFILKLIRGGYDEGTLLVLDESNVDRVESPSRPSFGELVNSVTVNYWDMTTGREASISAQDVAMIQSQGAVINTALQYPGFTSFRTASRVAARDLRSLSSPLFACTVIANRDANVLNIGDVFKLDWPDLEIASLVMRVSRIAYGDGKNNQIKIIATQDVFTLPESGTIMEPVNYDATPAEAEPALNTLALEAPYYELVQANGATFTDDMLTSTPEIGMLQIAAARPGSCINAEAWTDSGSGYEAAATVDFCPSATLAAAVTESTTVFSVASALDLASVTLGTHAQVDAEILRVDSVDLVGGTVTLGRGCLDTVPKPHLSGAMLYFWDVYATGIQTEYVSGEAVSVKLLTSTGSQSLDIVDAYAASVTMAGRAARPYAPGNFTINGFYFPSLIDGLTDPLSLAWAHRDRKLQTGAAIVDFLDASIGPEVGTTYTLRIYGETGTLGKTVTGLTGTSYSYPFATELADFPALGRPNGKLRLVLESVRAGLTSYQAHDVTFTRAGYGFSYGNNYGGM